MCDMLEGKMFKRGKESRGWGWEVRLLFQNDNGKIGLNETLSHEIISLAVSLQHWGGAWDKTILKNS